MSSNAIFGIEQEYVFWDSNNDWPSGWVFDSDDEVGIEPEKSDLYYCGLGIESVMHRQLAESHAELCLQMNIPLTGFNSEVMKSQWEYQLAPATALDASDNLWMSRYMLMRLAEARGIAVNLEPKPVDGWSGSGAHINISTEDMREGTIDDVYSVVHKLGDKHDELISVYGESNDKRLTGTHETESIDTFSFGEMDRTSSVRIPFCTIDEGCGHVEDRRPASNVNPYIAFAKLIPIFGAELAEV